MSPVEELRSAAVLLRQSGGQPGSVEQFEGRIREMVDQKVPHRRIAKELGLTHAQVKNFCYRKGIVIGGRKGRTFRDLGLTPYMSPVAALVALADYVAETDTGCWQWSRSLTTHGYGKIEHLGQDVGAHRYVWLELRGPIPAGLELDHLCRNRACVNPDHLEPVTPSENQRRASAARGEYDDCPKHGPKRPSEPGKPTLCRGCRADQARERRARLRGTEPPQHGVRSAYVVYKCRCDACVAAQHAYANSRLIVGGAS